MQRESPNARTLKILYVRSGNECAFPECEHPIFNDNGLYIAQLCHINAANKNGPRYDENQTNETRRAPENLMFMCHRHHKETDDEELYPSDVLRRMKNQHELKYTEAGKAASKEMIQQILLESKYFWDTQAKKTFDFPDFKIIKDLNQDIFALFDEIIDNIQNIRNYCDHCAHSDKILQADLDKLLKKAGINPAKLKGVPYYENPFFNRNWEMHNIGSHNFFSHISLTINQLRAKITDELLKNQPKNKKLKELAEKFKKEFEADYESSYYID